VGASQWARRPEEARTSLVVRESTAQPRRR